jgi:hypothetical protein
MKMINSNFNVSHFIHYTDNSRHSHAEIDIFAMNPFFLGRYAASALQGSGQRAIIPNITTNLQTVFRSRQFMAAILQLLQSKYIFYALPPGHQPPSMLHLMHQLPARHGTLRGGAAEAEFALYGFSRRVAYAQKTVINAQVRQPCIWHDHTKPLSS